MGVGQRPVWARIATGDTSQSRIVGAALAVINDPALTIQWKTEAGFVTLDAAQVLAVAQADDACDIEAGWP